MLRLGGCALLLAVLGGTAFAHPQEPAVKSETKRPVETAFDPSTDPDWENIECLSDGTCRYKNKFTGEIRLHKQKTAPAKPALTGEEEKLVADRGIDSLEAFNKRVELANKAGKKYLIVQVGNLEGCPPCQAINRTIMASEMAKDAEVGVYDINYIKARGTALAKYFHDSLALPQGFSFPRIYLFELDGKKWITRYQGMSREEAQVMDGVETTLKSLKKTAAAKEKQK